MTKREMARLWRANGAAKGGTAPFHPPIFDWWVYEMAQSRSPEPNWRTKWRGIGALSGSRLAPNPNPTRVSHDP